MRICIICGLPLGKKKSCPRCKELREKSINGDCSYCLKIYESTSSSPRKKYKYCPMCSKELDVSRLVRRCSTK